MRMRVLVTPAIICAFVLAGSLAGQDRGGTPPAVGQTRIGGVFTKADASGSLEYWGLCNAKHFYPDFPKLKKISSNELSLMESLREMFSLDPKMKVSQDADGKIRMIEEDVPSDLLDVKIHELQFPVEYHGPNAAIVAIVKTPEVMDSEGSRTLGRQLTWAASPGFRAKLTLLISLWFTGICTM